MWGTGDGFYLTDARLHEGSFALFYGVATDLIERMRSHHNLELRVALLIGNCGRIKVDRRKNGVRFLAGTGLNDAERIVSFAAPGQVVFTDEYCRSWDENATPITFYPDLEQPGYRIFAKHFVPMVVRFNSVIESDRVATVRKVASELDRELGFVGKTVMEKFFSEASFQNLAFGASLLKVRAGRHDKKHLIQISRRSWARGGVSPFPDVPSMSVDPPVGLGIAFSTGSLVAVSNLPDPYSDPSGYDEALLREFRVEGSKFRNANWCPRSIFATPLTLFESDQGPSGVLCLDLSDPLQGWSQAESVNVLEFLANLVKNRLSLLSILID